MINLENYLKDVVVMILNPNMSNNIVFIININVKG
jgi:hypothetical protein